jgi:hypothetical protein
MSKSGLEPILSRAEEPSNTSIDTVRDLLDVINLINEYELKGALVYC